MVIRTGSSRNQLHAHQATPPQPSPLHSPFSSSAAKKAARQSSRVTTGPQNQLGVQDTTNLGRQNGGGGVLPGPGQDQDLDTFGLERHLGQVGGMGRGLESNTWDQQPAARCLPEPRLPICEGAPVALACPLGRWAPTSGRCRPGLVAHGEGSRKLPTPLPTGPGLLSSCRPPF